MTICATTRDWFDYATLGVGFVVALGTVGAVVVALFGPIWTARKRTPSVFARSADQQAYSFIALSAPPANFEDLTKDLVDTSRLPFTCLVGNEAGRDEVRELEVYISLSHEVLPGAWQAVLRTVPLARVGSIPPNFQRHIPLVFFGDLQLVNEQLAQASGLLSADQFVGIGGTSATCSVAANPVSTSSP